MLPPLIYSSPSHSLWCRHFYTAFDKRFIPFTTKSSIEKLHKIFTPLNSFLLRHHCAATFHCWRCLLSNCHLPKTSSFIASYKNSSTSSAPTVKRNRYHYPTAVLHHTSPLTTVPTAMAQHSGNEPPPYIPVPPIHNIYVNGHHNCLCSFCFRPAHRHPSGAEIIWHVDAVQKATRFAHVVVPFFAYAAKEQIYVSKLFLDGSFFTNKPNLSILQIHKEPPNGFIPSQRKSLT